MIKSHVRCANAIFVAFLQNLIRSLTAIVIVVSREELEAQREGCEALDFLREPDRAEGSVGRVALPPLYSPFGLMAALKLVLGYQIERQHLRRAVLGRAGWVVWAQDVQVVVQIYLDCVVITC